MLQLFLYALPSQRVQKTNLLPTGVVIASNNNHRRLLPTEGFGPPTQSILGYRTETSFLSNQLLARLAIRTSDDTVLRRVKAPASPDPSAPDGGSRCG